MRTMIVDEGRTDVLAWKCATQDFEFGTRLNVHESQMAVFFRDGQLIEVLGPGMHVLETRNFPFLRFFTKLRFGRYFHAEVYFVNLSVQMSLPWGTRERVNVMLDVEPGKAMPLDVGASGTMNVQPDPDQVKEMLVWLVGTGEELTAEIAHSEEIYENIEAFLPVIWKYTNITELTPHILNELIEKIVVHEKVMAEDGSKRQQVDIHYKFIGCVNWKREPGSYAAVERTVLQECKCLIEQTA